MFEDLYNESVSRIESLENIIQSQRNNIENSQETIGRQAETINVIKETLNKMEEQVSKQLKERIAMEARLGMKINQITDQESRTQQERNTWMSEAENRQGQLTKKEEELK